MAQKRTDQDFHTEDKLRIKEAISEKRSDSVYYEEENL